MSKVYADEINKVCFGELKVNALGRLIAEYRVEFVPRYQYELEHLNNSKYFVHHWKDILDMCTGDTIYGTFKGLVTLNLSFIEFEEQLRSEQIKGKVEQLLYIYHLVIEKRLYIAALEMYARKHDNYKSTSTHD